MYAGQYHMNSSSLELIKDTFLFFYKLTADQVMVVNWIAGQCQVNLLQLGSSCLEAG